MSRLPFNPDRIAPPDVPPPAKAARTPRGDKPLTVSQVAAAIKDAMNSSFPGKVKVVGEISNFSERAHWFFSLKDAGATIRCVCFASSARKINFPVADGMEVVATGRVDFYDAQGSVQIYVDNLEPVGQGALDIKFRLLCEELRRLGYFEESRKKPLPAMPTRIAVVTSRTGAALQDVIDTVCRRWAGCGLLLFDVRVQGAAAAPEIAAAIDAISAHGTRLGIDAIILTRGGGSMEDLWAFNERVVADAIYKCKLPIVAAIGHEVDITVAELVADVRSATPTQAAMTLIPDRRTLEQQVGQMAQRLSLVLRRQSERSRERLENIMRSPIFRRPQQLLDPARQRLDGMLTQLQATLPRRVKTSEEKLAGLARHLKAVSPTNVLERGYSITLDAAGHVLRNPMDAAAGTRITSVLAEGRLASEVVGAGEVPPLPPKAAVKVPTTRPRSARPSSEPTLFNE